MRAGRIGMAREVARYTRLMPRVCGTSGGATAGPMAGAPSALCFREFRDSVSGARGATAVWLGAELSPSRLAPVYAAQHGWSQAAQNAVGAGDLCHIRHSGRCHTIAPSDPAPKK